MNNPRFKVWDKLSKKIIYPNEIVFEPHSAIGTTWSVIEREKNIRVVVTDSLNAELMQSIEKTDADGYEFFLGDIVKHPQYLGLWEIIYTPYATVGLKQIRHITNCKDQDCFGQTIMIIEDWENIKHIGNKFENPELLQGEKKHR